MRTSCGEDVVDRSNLNLKRRALHTPFTDLGPFLPSPPTAEIYYGRSAVFRYDTKYRIMHLTMLLEDAISEDTETHMHISCSYLSSYRFSMHGSDTRAELSRH